MHSLHLFFILCLFLISDPSSTASSVFPLPPSWLSALASSFSSAVAFSPTSCYIGLTLFMLGGYGYTTSFIMVRRAMDRTRRMRTSFLGEVLEDGDKGLWGGQRVKLETRRKVREVAGTVAVAKGAARMAVRRSWYVARVGGGRKDWNE
jgi:hypothetical protein